MVGGLVEQQHVRRLQEQAAEGHAAALTAGQGGDLRIGRRALQGIHRALQLGIDLPAVVVLDELRELALALDQLVHLIVVHRLAELHADLVVLGKEVHHLLDTLLDDLQHGFVGIHLRLLLQVSDAVARGPDHLALVGFLHAGDDLQERRFTGTVQTDDADLGAVEEG